MCIRDSSYAGCLGLSPAISSQFSVKMWAASKNCKKKFTKNPFWWVQGHSRSSMLINLRSKSSVLVMICSKSVPICNRFHTIRANSGKKNVFLKGHPSLTPSFEGNPLTQKHKILSLKTRVLATPCGIPQWRLIFVILAYTILIQITSVTDRQTDA